MKRYLVQMLGDDHSVTEVDVVRETPKFVWVDSKWKPGTHNKRAKQTDTEIYTGTREEATAWVIDRLRNSLAMTNVRIECATRRAKSLRTRLVSVGFRLDATTDPAPHVCPGCGQGLPPEDASCAD